MKIYWEEQLGPVIPVIAFDDELAPVDYVTESKYGMQASIFSETRNAFHSTSISLHDSWAVSILMYNVSAGLTPSH